MPMTTINFDEKTEQTLEDLKHHLSAASKAEVVRRAIALLNVARAAEQPDGSVVIRKDGQDVRVLIR